MLNQGMVNKLFRRIPPKDLVISILQSCGFQGLHDLRWFSKDELNLSGVEEWLPILEAYYLPCKSARFFTEAMDSSKLVTILRHIVRPYDYDLLAQERLYRDSKQTLYQIRTRFFDLSGLSHTVEFT